MRQYKANQLPAALVTLEKELLIRREIGDRKSEGQSLHRIGAIYGDLQQYQKALEVYEQALAIHKQEGDLSFESITLSNMGIIYRRLAKYSKALEVHQQALAIREKIGDRKGLGTTLNSIGLVYNSLGDYPNALAFYQRSLAIRNEVGDAYGKFITLENMGDNYLKAMGASTFPNQNPLPNVPAELDAITRTSQGSDRQGIYPGSKFLNRTFDYEALQTSLQTGTRCTGSPHPSGCCTELLPPVLLGSLHLDRQQLVGLQPSSRLVFSQAVAQILQWMPPRSPAATVP
jgi:tetratricopeptide (TPR) repeat protein